MITTKRVAAVLAAAAIAGLGIQSAGAQTATTLPAGATNQAPVVVNVRVSGPVPAGVTGAAAVFTCLNPTQVLPTAGFGTAGGTATIFVATQAAVVTTTNPSGTTASCSILVAVTGTANTGAASVTASAAGATAAPGFASGVGSATLGPVAIPTNGTTINVNITFPSISVRKVVNGEEPTAGFAYPMTIACSNTRTAFPAANGIVVNGAGTWVSVAGPLTGTGPGLPIAAGSFLNLADVAGFGTGAPVGANVVADATFQSADRTLLTIQAAGAGNVWNFDQASTARILAALNAAQFTAPLAPAATFPNGAFTLVGGAATRVFGLNEFPGLTGASQCEVTELNNQGGVTAYSSTNVDAAGTATANLPGVQAGTVFKSALTKAGQTITVTNSFVGDMIVSKVVTGDPKTNIAIYEISVACNQGGPKETFVLRDRQSRVFSGIITGTSCLVTETKSDGAEVSYNDNSGDNTTDGRVVIKRNVTTCEKGIIGQENNCLASVIVTNSYNVTTTTAAAAATTVATTAAPATTAPVVDEAPAQEIVEEPTFTG